MRAAHEYRQPVCVLAHRSLCRLHQHRARGSQTCRAGGSAASAKGTQQRTHSAHLVLCIFPADDSPHSRPGVLALPFDAGGGNWGATDQQHGRSRFTAGAASRPRRPGAPAASATSTAAPPSQVHAPAPARRGLAHQLQQPTAASGVLGKIIHEPQLTTSRPARDCEIGAVTRSLRARWQSQGAGVRVRCSCTRRACSSCQSDAPLVSPA